MDSLESDWKGTWVSQHRAPEPVELKALVCEMIDRVMKGGKFKHGEHIWYNKETVRHHADRTARHAITSSMRWEGDEPISVDGEDGIDHMERAVIRGLFALAKMKAIVYRDR
jgi:hypothetical protein